MFSVKTGNRNKRRRYIDSKIILNENWIIEVREKMVVLNKIFILTLVKK